MTNPHNLPASSAVVIFPNLPRHPSCFHSSTAVVANNDNPIMTQELTHSL
jgi:hypothetical protein